MGATLRGDIAIGARAHAGAGTGFFGRIAGVRISEDTACVAVHRFWYNAEIDMSGIVNRCSGLALQINAAADDGSSGPAETCSGWRKMLSQTAGNYRNPTSWLRYNPRKYSADFSELNQLETDCRGAI